MRAGDETSFVSYAVTHAVTRRSIFRPSFPSDWRKGKVARDKPAIAVLRVGALS
jgi:hypothetical protein